MKATRFNFAGIVLLLLMFALMVSSMKNKSPTFDEQGFITRGLGYIRGENNYMRVGHPLGLNLLNAFLLKDDAAVRLPTDDPSWALTRFHRPSELFMWERGNDVAHIIFLARLPTIWLSLLLVATAGQWAFTLSRKGWTGLLAMTLLALDPNILAHSRLATTDLGLTAFAFFAGIALWWYWKKPGMRRGIVAGIFFGLLQNTKFTAGLFIPLFGLVILLAFWQHWRWERSWRPLLILMLTFPLAAFLTLWGMYGFQIGTLPPELPALPQLAGITLPLSHHVEQLLDIGGRLQKSTPAFLLGQYSDTGWWTYFPVAFLLKTPLPILIFLLAAIALFLWQRQRLGKAAWEWGALLIPPLGYFAIALTTDVNLGYRHILPVLPYLVVFMAVVLTRNLSILRRRESTAAGKMDTCLCRYDSSLVTKLLLSLMIAGIVWLAGISFYIHPHYLAYFNLLAGGPDNGWRSLVDSNLDWGQDLAALQIWMDENEVEQVWLSYFGEGRPDYYGINYRGLASWPPRLMNPQARSFYPPDPAPGVYAISATMLQGVHLDDLDLFAWFRVREPIAKIGYSIFIYDVPADGEPVSIVMNDVQMDEISPQEFTEFKGNNLQPRWGDLTQCLILPQQMPSWQIVSPETNIYPFFENQLLQTGTVLPTEPRRLIRIDGNDSPQFMDFTIDTLTFLADGKPFIKTKTTKVLYPGWIPAGGTMELDTNWVLLEESKPLKIFLHVLNPITGELITQWDGVCGSPETWQAGDFIWHTHSLQFPLDTPAGLYQIWAGIYNPLTLERYRSENGRETLMVGEILVRGN